MSMAVVAAPDSSRLYVANAFTNTVSVVATATSNRHNSRRLSVYRRDNRPRR
jgi:DNA-binding beta-propeller fold protein YncE